jgi:hypothetical protein
MRHKAGACKRLQGGTLVCAGIGKENRRTFESQPRVVHVQGDENENRAMQRHRKTRPTARAAHPSIMIVLVFESRGRLRKMNINIVDWSMQADPSADCVTVTLQHSQSVKRWCDKDVKGVATPPPKSEVGQTAVTSLLPRGADRFR